MKSTNIICPYCNYNYDEDKPDITWETEKYMIQNKIDVAESSIRIFESEDIYRQCQVGYIDMICYRCDKKFRVHRDIFYRSEKNDEEKS